MSKPLFSNSAEEMFYALCGYRQCYGIYLQVCFPEDCSPDKDYYFWLERFKFFDEHVYPFLEELGCDQSIVGSNARNEHFFFFDNEKDMQDLFALFKKAKHLYLGASVSPMGHVIEELD